jgi:thiol-disulfide isomerase/thioredoxin
MRCFLLLISFLFLLSCKKNTPKTLQKATYKAILKVQDNQKIPFIFEIKNHFFLTISNANEIISVDKITYYNDSIRIQMPVFEGYIIAKIENYFLKESFIKPSLDRFISFEANKNSVRFSSKNKVSKNITGSRETVFSKNFVDEKYIEKGIFNQNKDNVTRTFRTTTGDYRYLEDIVDGDSLKFSTFNGAHAFLFSTKITDFTLNGFFYSENHWKEPFTIKLNNAYELPNVNNLTFIREGSEDFDFSFPDTIGRIVSLSDPKFQNKAVIIQIMRTWCPNCLNESKFLVNYLEENPTKKIAVIPFAFEVAKTRKIALERINRLKEKAGIKYPVILAQYGSSADNKLAQQIHVG